jgi:hypothetical protein
MILCPTKYVDADDLPYNIYGNSLLDYTLPSCHAVHPSKVVNRGFERRYYERENDGLS